MKTILALTVLTVLASISESSIVRANSRANLNIGYPIFGDRLLYRAYIYKPALANTIQSEDVVYRGNLSTRITAVQATEVGASQYSSAYIINGGVGRNNVTVRFQSMRGWGYYYLFDIWGH